MICPKCGSENVTIQIVQTSSNFRKAPKAIKRLTGLEALQTQDTSKVCLCQNCGHSWTLQPETKKPVVKKWVKWFFGIVVGLWILIILIASCSGNSENDTPVATTAPIETTTPTENIEAQDESISALNLDSKNIIEIQGETSSGPYCKDVHYNAGTSNETVKTGWFVPAGRYLAINNDTKAPWQPINVYSPETQYTPEGFEEPIDGTVYMVNQGESVEIEVPDGWFIYLAPSKYTNIELIPIIE